MGHDRVQGGCDGQDEVWAGCRDMVRYGDRLRGT